METVVDKGCGLNVHKETVVACVMGAGIAKEVRTYGIQNDRRAFKAQGVAARLRDNPCSHGKYRCLLEASV